MCRQIFSTCDWSAALNARPIVNAAGARRLVCGTRGPHARCRSPQSRFAQPFPPAEARDRRPAGRLGRSHCCVPTAPQTHQPPDYESDKTWIKKFSCPKFPQTDSIEARINQTFVHLCNAWQKSIFVNLAGKSKYIERGVQVRHYCFCYFIKTRGNHCAAQTTNFKFLVKIFVDIRASYSWYIILYMKIYLDLARECENYEGEVTMACKKFLRFEKHPNLKEILSHCWS